MKKNTNHAPHHENPLDTNKPLLTTSELAVVLDTRPETQEQWRLKGIGPKFIRLPGSRLIRYRRQDVLDYISGMTAVSSTTEADQVQEAL